jgi:hypothetical protein
MIPFLKQRLWIHHFSPFLLPWYQRGYSLPRWQRSSMFLVEVKTYKHKYLSVLEEINQ